MAGSSSNVYVSQMFSDPTADVVFKSSDDILYRLHSKSLAITAGGLALHDNIVVDSDPVRLEEPSKVLDILFQFVEPPTEARDFRYPTMAGIEPEALFSIAEAAEKYMVFGAMCACTTAMHYIPNSHSLEVLNHAYKHGYKDLMRQAATSTFMPVDLGRAAQILTAPGLLAKWLYYYDGLRKVVAVGEEWFHGCLTDHNCDRLAILHSTFTRRTHEYPGDPLSFRNDIVGYNRFESCPRGKWWCGCSLDRQNVLDGEMRKVMMAMHSFDKI